MKRIKQSSKEKILVILEVYLKHIYNICFIYLREVLHFPRNVVYLNGFILVINVLGNETYENIFEMFKLVNTISVYMLIFYFMLAYKIVIYIYSIVKAKSKNEVLSCRKAIFQSNIRKVRVTMYENGVFKFNETVNVMEEFKNTPLEEIPFTVNNLYPNKIYKIDIVEVENE